MPKLSLVTAPAAHPRETLSGFDAVPSEAWQSLHTRAVEPNAYYDPLWAKPAALTARGLDGALALLAWDRNDTGRLIGLQPVRWARSALSLPIPLLVAWKGYASLVIPTLDRKYATEAAGGLIDAARENGARALLLPGAATDGPAAAAFTQALADRGLAAEVLCEYRRAGLDATQQPEAALKTALGAKKLKELRRQRNRLEDSGAVTVEVASTPETVAPALKRFLELEMRGWKGRRGTGLDQHKGDAAFIREASAALAAKGDFEIVSLVRNGAAIAAGLVLRDRDHAFFFKIAMDESEARLSPGVQLTLELTKHLCADARIRFADSSADGSHPMIDHLWRERITIADLFIPLRAGDPVAAAIKALLRARYAAIECVRAIRRTKEKLS